MIFLFQQDVIFVYVIYIIALELLARIYFHEWLFHKVIIVTNFWVLVKICRNLRESILLQKLGNFTLQTSSFSYLENWLLPNQPRIFTSVKRLITNTRVLYLLITNIRYTFENVDLIKIPLPHLCWKIRKKTGPTMSISLVKPHSQYQGRACFIKAVHGCDSNEKSIRELRVI